LLSTREHEIETLGSKFIELDAGLVAQAKFVTSLPSAFVFSEKNNLHVSPERFPALKSVSLEKCALIPKRLCCSKKRQHVTYSTSIA
jgi:hypothetical protein